MKLLVLTTVLPRRRRMGSEAATQAIVDALRAEGHEVVVAGYQRRDDVFPTLSSEIAVGVRAIETARAGLAPAWWLAQGLALGLPYTTAKYRSRAYTRLAAKLAGGFDAVIVDHAQLGWLRRALGRGVRAIAVAHNVEHAMYAQLAQRAANPVKRWLYGREARLIAREERALAGWAGELWALTPQDAAALRQLAPAARLRVIPLPAAAATTAAQAKAFDVALIGSWAWQANLEGLRWFLDRVLPLLPAGMTVRIAGSGADWLRGRHDQVDVAGFVPDAQVFLAQARVVAIPTLSGGGIQVKTLDAIAAGSRIVATNVALRGIADVPPTVTLCDDPAQFAQALRAAVAAAEDAGARVGAIAWSQARAARFRAELAAGVAAVVANGAGAVARERPFALSRAA